MELRGRLYSGRRGGARAAETAWHGGERACDGEKSVSVCVATAKDSDADLWDVEDERESEGATAGQRVLADV